MSLSNSIPAQTDNKEPVWVWRSLRKLSNCREGQSASKANSAKGARLRSCCPLPVNRNDPHRKLKKIKKEIKRVGSLFTSCWRPNDYEEITTKRVSAFSALETRDRKNPTIPDPDVLAQEIFANDLGAEGTQKSVKIEG